MKLKYILALLTGLLVASSTMKADDGAAVTVSADAPNHDPACFGTPVSVAFHAHKTDPPYNNKEIKITSWNYEWSAWDDWGYVDYEPSGGADWTPDWVPLSCGINTLTAEVTVTFTGTQDTYTSNPKSYSTTAPGGASATVKAVSVSLSMPAGEKIGVTAKGHDRTKHYYVAVCPSDEVSWVMLSSGSRLNMSNIQYGQNGQITFDLVGTDKSNDPGDTYVKATHAIAGCSVTKTATVIIPADVGKPHPTFDDVVTPFNLVCNASSSPSYFPTPPSSPLNTVLQTAWIVTQTIPVVDQFGSPCGGLYDGSIITENGGTPINKTLSGSSYSDSVGPGVYYPPAPTTANDPRVARWPFMRTDLNGEPTVGKNFDSAPAVEVDGFTLTPGLAGRSYTYMGNNHLKIEWP